MKKISFVLILILFSITCIESYSLPLKLVVNELPSDYDHKIDEFAEFFYGFVDCQNPDLNGYQNEDLTYNYIKKIPIKKLEKIRESLWIFRNKYPDYFEEFLSLNIVFSNELKIAKDYSQYSIVNMKYEKSNLKNNTHTINGMNDCIRNLGSYYWEKTGISPEPLLHFYYVCNILNYQKILLPDPVFFLIKVDVSVENHLGFNSYRNMNSIYIPCNIQSGISYKELNNLVGKKYLIPIYNTPRFEYNGNGMNFVNYPCFNLNDIFEVNNSIVKTKLDRDYRDVIKKRAVQSGLLKYFLFKNNETLSLNDIEANINSYIKRK